MKVEIPINNGHVVLEGANEIRRPAEPYLILRLVPMQNGYVPVGENGTVSVSLTEFEKDQLEAALRSIF